MTTSTPRTVTLETTLAGAGGKTGIVVPEHAIEGLGACRRPPVLVDLNGYQYRSTVAVMSSQYMIGVSANVRAATGLTAGDPLRVTLTVMDLPREVDVPADLAAALVADAQIGQLFAALSNSLQRYHVANISAAKTADTRQRRIDTMIALLRSGKKRQRHHLLLAPTAGDGSHRRAYDVTDAQRRAHLEGRRKRALRIGFPLIITKAMSASVSSWPPTRPRWPTSTSKLRTSTPKRSDTVSACRRNEPYTPA